MLSNAKYVYDEYRIKELLEATFGHIHTVMLLKLQYIILMRKIVITKVSISCLKHYSVKASRVADKMG